MANFPNRYYCKVRCVQTLIFIMFLLLKCDPPICYTLRARKTCFLLLPVLGFYRLQNKLIYILSRFPERYQGRHPVRRQRGLTAVISPKMAKAFLTMFYILWFLLIVSTLEHTNHKGTQIRILCEISYLEPAPKVWKPKSRSPHPGLYLLLKTYNAGVSIIYYCSRGP